MPISVLMCPPTYFDIEYEINPWMHTDNQVSRELAQEQWQKLHDIYTKKLEWNVLLVEPIEGLPDMVFTANGGLVISDKVALPTFRAPDRQPETAHFQKWFNDKGIKEFFQPKYDFEGEGDALVWNDIIFAGYPWRSDRATHNELAEFFGAKVISLQLTDARFYHLDTCLTIVDAETVALWPKAFTEESLKKVHEAVPNVIEATDDEAMSYCLNAMSDTKSIVMPERATGLVRAYQERGLHVYTTPISEFQKSGGGVKCLTLELRS